MKQALSNTEILRGPWRRHSGKVPLYRTLRLAAVLEWEGDLLPPAADRDGLSGETSPSHAAPEAAIPAIRGPPP